MNKTIIYLTILSALSIGCDSSGPLEFKVKSRFEERVVPINEDDPLDFKTLQAKILIPHCKSCHWTGNAKPTYDPIDFSSYEAMMIDRPGVLIVKGDPERGRFYESVYSGSMPSDAERLSHFEIDYIKRWILACAPKEVLTGPLKKCEIDDDDSNDEPGEGDEPFSGGNDDYFTWRKK